MTAPLEQVLGDPFAEGPFSYSSLLAADDARELSAGSEDLLHEWGANAELVPARLGGRWVSTREMVDRLMPVFRRDPALGLGFGVTSLMACVNVWLAGSPAQQRDVAGVLLDGGRVAVAFHELDHGNDLTRNACRLDDGPHGRVLRGTKAVINNIDRADRVVLMARTSPQDGPRSHSLVLWDPASGEGVRRHSRYRTAGMRGVRLGGTDLDGAPVPGGSLIGPEGTATETALRAFQVTRSVLPAMAIGSLDAALHVAVDYAAGRRLYGTTVLDLPYSRRILAVAWTDLLLADALASAAVRALHVAPEMSFLLSAACKYLVPELVQDGLDELATLLGSTFYGRVAPYGILEKLVRDLTVLPIGHAGGTSCLMSMVPHLPRWARGAPVPYEPRLLDDDALAGEPDLARLTLGVAGRDGLTGALHDEAARGALEAASPGAAALVGRHADRLDALAATVAASPRVRFTGLCDQETFDLARDLSVLLAASAVVGTWYAHRAEGTHRSDPRWLAATLRRSAALLGLAGPDLDGDAHDLAATTLVARRSGLRSTRLTAEPVFTPSP
ncbi:acyl-CoA dehydrogenase [Myceligenerans halotolerans]